VPPPPPPPPPPQQGRRRSTRRGWLVVGIAAALVGIVLAVVVVGGVGTDGRSGDGSGEPWVSTTYGDSHGLVTDGERVCSTTLTGNLYCLDAATGEEVFSEEIGESVTSPVLVDDVMLVGSEGLTVTQRGVGLHAYSFDGERLWYEPIDLSYNQQLPVVDGVVAVIEGHGGAELVGVDVVTGEERWRAFPSDVSDAPSLSDQVLTDGRRFYVGMETDFDSDTADAHVVAVDPATGAELWRAGLGPDVQSLHALDDLALSEDGTVATLMAAALEGTNQLVVLDTATGQVLRQTPLTSSDASTMQGSGMSVIPLAGTTIMADGANLGASDASGRVLWEAPAPTVEPGTSPANPGELVDEGGRLYLVGEDVVEIDPATGAATPVAEGVNATDVVAVDDLLVVAGAERLEARSL